MNILIVDNDVAVAETFRAAIHFKTDYMVSVAYGGKEAIDKIKTTPLYNLIILDIMMPDVSGIDVCKMMVKDESLNKIPVLLVSALPVASPVFQESLGKFDELNVIKGVLEKPFDIDNLIEKIKEVARV